MTDSISTTEGYAAYSLLARALDAMEALHSSITPDEDCDEGIVPAAALRQFVDTHAMLLHERERAAFSSICSHCADDWRPIETAPKLGHILGHWKGYTRPCVMWWNVADRAWESWTDRKEAPTHWMPLPEGPQ